jgi:FMN reductase [NAD(P)H]
MNVNEAVMKRKSIRSYQDQEVPAGDIATVIDAGRWAPNAGAYNMSVIRNKDLMRRINDKTLEPSDMPITQLNCAVSVESMLLQATELGLGSCFLRSPCYALNNPANAPLAREAGIPEGSQMECGLVFGYIDDEKKYARLEREPRGTITYVD